MGLRMFVEPDAAEPKPTVKADPTASARSSIRRQRTVRYSPNVRDHQATLSSLLSRNQRRSQGRMRMLADRRSLLEDIRRRDQNTALSASQPENARDLEAAADLAHSEASQRSRLESGRVLLRDALSYERSGQRNGMAQENTLAGSRSVRNHASTPSSDDVEVSRTLSWTEGTRSPPPRYIPTPPHTSGDISRRSTPHVSTPPVGTASLTPGFAPAHGLQHQNEMRANLEREEILSRLSARMGELRDPGEREYVAGHRAEINRMRSRDPSDLTLDYREAEAAYLESVETRLDLMHRMRERDLSELPPLHRMSRPFQDIVRATHSHSHSGLDGLGDRERSFSPDDDQWETMLTTIQPDERIPSTNTSFTSASASSSSLSSNAISSFGTLVTAPSTSAEVEACPADLDDSEDDALDLLDAQITHAENINRRIEYLSRNIQSLDHRQHDWDEADGRRSRRLERENELQQLETNLRRLERQIFREQPSAAGRHRRDGARERL